MTNPVWLVFVLMAILLWSTTSLLYKAGARDGNESHICLKYSVCVGMEYAIFALGCWIYLYWKEGKVYNPFTRRSAPRLLGALTDNVGMVFYSYAMAMNSVSTDLIIAYLVLGRDDSVSRLLSP